MEENKSMFLDDYAKKTYKLFLLFTVLIGLILAGLSFIKPSFADDEEDDDYSYYNVSSSITSFYDQLKNNDVNEIAGKDKPDGFTRFNVDMGSAGAFVGYADKDRSKGPIGALISAATSAEQNKSYTMFNAGDGIDGQIRAYMEYGHALYELGLDTPISKMSKFGRKIAGFFLGVAFAIASISDLVVSLVIAILKFFNPFSWFKNSAFIDGALMSDIAQSNTAFAGLVQMVSEWYDAIYDLGLLLSAFFFIVAITVFMFANKAAGNLKSPFKKFATRVAFIILFVPVMGGLYTSALDSLSSDIRTSYGASSMVNSLLLDFENWAQQGQLDLPQGTIITVTPNNNKGGGSVRANRNPRSIANNINYILFEQRIGNPGGASNGGIMDGLTESKGFTKEASNKFTDSMGLISRYSNATTYDAATYETYSKKAFNSSAEAMAGIKTASKVDYYVGDDSDEKAEGTTPSFDFLIRSSLVARNVGENIVISSGSSNLARGLSDIALYNYLNSNFTDSQVSVSSSSRQSSKMVVNEHASVTLVGQGGAAKFTNYMLTISALLVLGCLGLFYGLGLLANSFGKGIRLIVNMFPAMGGSFRGMSKMVMIALSMIVELFMTLVAYAIAKDLFLAANVILTEPLSQLFKPAGFDISDMAYAITLGKSQLVLGADFSARRGMLGVLFSIIGTFINLFLGIKLIRLRVVLVKGLNETLSGLTDNLFGKVSGTDINGAREEAGRSGSGEALAKAAGAAGGTFAAGRAISKLTGGKDKDSEEGEGKDGDVKGKDSADKSQGEDVKGSANQLKALRKGKDGKDSDDKKDSKKEDKDSEKDNKDAKSREGRDGGALIAPEDIDSEEKDTDDVTEDKGRKLLDSDVTSLEDVDNIESSDDSDSKDSDNEDSDDVRAREGDAAPVAGRDVYSSDNDDKSSEDTDSDDEDFVDDKDTVDDRDNIDNRDNIVVAGEGDSPKPSTDEKDAKAKAEEARRASKEGKGEDKETSSKDLAKPSEDTKSTDAKSTSKKDQESKDSQKSDSTSGSKDSTTSNISDKNNVASPTEGDKPNRENKATDSKDIDGKSSSDTTSSTENSSDKSSNKAEPSEGDKLKTKKNKTVVLTDVEGDAEDEAKTDKSNVSNETKAEPSATSGGDAKTGSNVKSDDNVSDAFKMTDRSKDSALNATADDIDVNNESNVAKPESFVAGSDSKSQSDNARTISSGGSNESTEADLNNNVSDNAQTMSDRDSNESNESTSNNNKSNVNTSSSNNEPTEEEIEKVVNKSKSKKFADAVASSMDAGYSKDDEKRQGDMFGLESMSDPRLRNYGQEGSTNPYAKTEEAKATEAKEKAQRTTISGKNNSSNAGENTNSNTQTNVNGDSNINERSKVNSNPNGNRDSNVDNGSNVNRDFNTNNNPNNNRRSNATVNTDESGNVNNAYEASSGGSRFNNMSERDRANIGSNISNDAYSSDGSFAASNRVGGYEASRVNNRESISNDGSGGNIRQNNVGGVPFANNVDRGINDNGLPYERYLNEFGTELNNKGVPKYLADTNISANDANILDRRVSNLRDNFRDDFTGKTPDSVVSSLKRERKLVKASDDELKDAYRAYRETNYLRKYNDIFKDQKNIENSELEKILRNGEKMRKSNNRKLRDLAKKYNLTPKELGEALSKAKPKKK